jgi:hypothetical protein
MMFHTELMASLIVGFGAFGLAVPKKRFILDKIRFSFDCHVTDLTQLSNNDRKQQQTASS